VIVERGSVLGMGVLHRPEHADLRPRDGRDDLRPRARGLGRRRGNLPSKDGKYSLYCAVIVKKVDEKTRSKTSLNELLRTAD
jgi:2,3,4,5-tetrahydropyridine-2-carboxylate N-succinyltransferase